jgi:hypothetical protein
LRSRAIEEVNLANVLELAHELFQICCERIAGTLFVPRNQLGQRGE